MPFFDKYPYTNFHNVNLDWILERVKEWGQMVEDNNTRFENLEQANADFKEYVTNYIENLDYQAAIDDKIDRMFESGELTEYLQPYISPVVTTWLDQHITEPEGVVIDSSLTVAGAAADAKSAGDKIFANTLSILSNGLTGDIRDAILQCFNNVAWVNTQGQLLYNYLKNALSRVNYIKYHWNTQTDSEYCFGVAGKITDSATYNGEYTCVLKTYLTRGCIMLKAGASSVLNQDLTDSGLYLIPIPENANNIKIESDNTNFIFWTHQRRYNGFAHIFTFIGDTGANNTSNPHICDVLTREDRGKANLLCVFVRRVDDVAFNTLPEIDITFY